MSGSRVAGGGIEANDATVSYWRSILENYTAPTPLIVDSSFDRSAATPVRMISARKELAPGTSQQLQAFLTSVGITSESFVISLWAMLLQHYCNEQSVLFGITATGLLEKTADIVPVSITVPEHDQVSTWMQQVQEATSRVSDVEVMSVEALHAYTGIPDDAPLFESLLVLNTHSQANELSTCADYPLNLIVDSEGFEIKYDSQRFGEKTIERMLGHLKMMIESILKNPQTQVCDVKILTDDELQQIVYDWNETAIEFPDSSCLHELFEQRVAADPDAIAAVYEDETLTYSELNQRANQLARHLQLKGAGPGKLVAISLGRGLDMVVGLVGISKSGAAYVPLDPEYPEDRLVFMLEDTRAPILLTESALLDNLPEHSAETVLIDQHWQEIAKQDSGNVSSGVTPEDLAYVIYTSGSTGRPKGAVLNHRGRVNNFCDFNRRYDIGPGDRILALASISFDMSAYDVFGTLACGGSIIIADSTTSQGASSWAKLMTRHEITVWHSVPALMEMLVDYVEERADLVPENLRLVLLGGDWIPVALPDRLKALVSTVQVVSMGGATEVSMDSTIYDINEPSSGWKSIPYGFPMANQLTYVLDANLKPVPIGVAGELHLGGVGVGEGYLNREELTAQKFIPNPFRPDERLYKTGDLARFGEDGNLELLGRIDFQVKIRGFRIELGEIESVLRNHEAVREGVILAREDAKKEKRLVAYVLQNTDYTGNDHDESEQAQVEQWQSVYDSAYSKESSHEDQTFNIVSWDSSYTEQPYPEEVMRIWVNSTVARIRSHQPRRVYEIGCGTGLLLFRVAPDCDYYFGTDISNVALDHVSRHVPDQGLDQVSLENRSAEDYSGLDENSFDAIVLNSIVMDFPTIEYLTEVLKGGARVVASGGVIFVGDVRDLNTLDAFHASIQLHKARSSLESDQFRQLIRRQSSVEEELLISPDYFVALAREIPEVSHVTVHHKRGKNNNEMSKFRYDVTMHIGDQVSTQADEPDWIDWESNNLDLNELKIRLQNGDMSSLALRGVPNLRLLEESLLLGTLEHDDCPLTVGDLRRQLKQDRKTITAIDPEDLWALADETGFDAEISYTITDNAYTYDVIFNRRKEGQVAIHNAYTPDLSQEMSLSDYANNPLQTKIRRKLTTQLRRHLTDRLPSYMVPSAFIVMDKFPLSPNGKLNRRALPEPDNLRPELEQEYVAPRNTVETVLEEIWCQCLGLEQVGVNDGFIALGGNSLLATQVVSRIRDIFQVEMPLSYGFNATLGELAGQLEDVARSESVDAGQTAEIYLEVSKLSASEVESMLS